MQVPIAEQAGLGVRIGMERMSVGSAMAKLGMTDNPAPLAQSGNNRSGKTLNGMAAI
jgi:hypothetical protein